MSRPAIHLSEHSVIPGRPKGEPGISRLFCDSSTTSRFRVRCFRLRARALRRTPTRRSSRGER